MGRSDPALRLEENTNVYRDEIARIHKSFLHSDLNFLVKRVGALSEGKRFCGLSPVTVLKVSAHSHGEGLPIAVQGLTPVKEQTVWHRVCLACSPGTYKSCKGRGEQW